MVRIMPPLTDPFKRASPVVPDETLALGLEGT
jgi:hypothetical protein